LNPGGSKTTAPGVFWRGLPVGAALAGIAFLSFHRLDVSLGGSSLAGAAALAALLAGMGVGAGPLSHRWQPGRAGLWFAALAVAAVGALWAWQGGAAAAVALAMLASVCAGVLLAPLVARGGALAFAAGAGGAFGALAVGLPRLVGVGMAAGGLAVAGLAVAALAPPGRAPQEPPDERINRPTPAALSLLVAAGVVCAALLRTYSYATGWQAYAAMDLGVALCLGIALRALVWPQDATQGTATLAPNALALLAIALLLNSSFFAYPYLIFSEYATLQSGRALLTPERMFPLWLFAGALAFVPPRSCMRSRALGSCLLAAGVGAALVLALPTRLPPAWHYGVAAALCALSLAPECARAVGRPAAGPRPPALSLVAAGVAVVAICWCIAGQPALRWYWLRRTFIWYAGRVRGRPNAPPGSARTAGVGDVRVLALRYTPQGITARAGTAGETARFVCGSLVASSRGLDSAPIRLAVALAVGAARGPGRVGIVEPALEETRAGVAALAPSAARVRIPARALPFGGEVPGRLDAVICGPGPLASGRCPLMLLSVEALRRLRAALAPQGRAVLWLPTRTLRPGELMRLLATVRAVFERAEVFSCGDELLLVCGRDARLDFSRLGGLFGTPWGRAYLEAGGFWDARQLAACYTGPLEEMVPAGARPYALAYPSRPPVLARDLSELARADTLALVAQHRLAGARRAERLLIFHGAAGKALALGRLEELRSLQTDAMMRAVGEAVRASDSPARAAADLVAALTGPAGRVELFAPGASTRRLALAIALQRLGLPERSLSLLQREAWPEGEVGSVWYWRGRALEALHRPEAAASAYEAALRQGAASAEVLIRLADLLLARREREQAMEKLRAALALEPGNVEALVRLSFLCGQMDRYKEAAELAERALRLAPEDPAAHELFVLYSSRAGARPRPGP